MSFDTHAKTLLFDNNTELVQSFGLVIIEKLDLAITKKQQASLVVSGGSTPQSLFNYLSEQDLDWSKVTITLADERCLPQEHQDSNANLIRTHLLINKAAKASFIYLYEEEETPDQAALNASERLKTIESFDVVILGMGTDGHTASLFPEASNLADALKDTAPDCLAIDPVTNNMMRVTQSKARLLKSKNIYFHLVGENKIDMLNNVLQDKEAKQYPAAHFIHQDIVPVTLYFAKQK